MLECLLDCGINIRLYPLSRYLFVELHLKPADLVSRTGAIVHRLMSHMIGIALIHHLWVSVATLMQTFRSKHPAVPIIKVPFCGAASRAGWLEQSIRCYSTSTYVAYHRNRVHPASLGITCYAGVDCGMSTHLYPLSRYVFVELHLEPAG